MTVGPSSNSVDYALQYAAAGLSVLPIACDGSKQPPPGQTWKHLQQRIASPDAIRRMFTPERGIAIIGGKVSGNLETLDIDAPDLVAAWEAVVREIIPGLLERLPTIATPRNNGGGRHYRYRTEGAVAGSTKLAQSELRPQFHADGTPDIDARTGKQRLAPETLIETRGEGGYALVPGSPLACHESGLPYKHIGGPPLTEVPLITAEEHRLLWQAARSFNRYVDEREVKNTPDRPTGKSSPGDAFNATATWDEILLPAGWIVVRTCGDLTFWRRPGKTNGISATTGVRSSGGTELLCVFSSNAFPLEGPVNGRVCSSYSKFAAYTTLNHGGDFSKAAKELKRNGFGTRGRNEQSVASIIRAVDLPDQYRPFPTAILPPLCAEFVKQAATSIDCDESMVALPLLGAIAAAIGNSYRIQLKPDYSEPAIVWAAVVSESGSRKSPALDSATRPLKRKEAEEFMKFKGEMEAYDLAMQDIRAASKSTGRRQSTMGVLDTTPVLPICQRYTVSDVTAEAIAARLEQNPRGLLMVRDELSGFFTGMNQYKSGGKGGDEAAYLAMHGARSLLVDRKNPEKPQIYVPLASLSIVGAIQPGVLQRTLTRTRMESGMAARFLMSYPPPRTPRWSENTIDTAVEARHVAMFDRLLSLTLNFDDQTNEPSPTLLPLSNAAKQQWRIFHDAHAEEQAELHGDLSAAWAKLTGYAARLSLLCELAAWASGGDVFPPMAIGATAMNAGIVLARWFSAETKRLYAILDESDDQREVRQLVEYIRQQGAVVTARQVSRGPRRYRNNVELAESELQRLAKEGIGQWIDQAAGDQGGRPTRAFRLNPAMGGDETPRFQAE